MAKFDVICESRQSAPGARVADPLAFGARVALVALPDGTTLGDLRRAIGAGEAKQADMPKCIDCKEAARVHGDNGGYYASCDKDGCTFGKTCSTPDEAFAAYRKLRNVEDDAKPSDPKPPAEYPYADRRPKRTCRCDICIHLENVGVLVASGKDDPKPTCYICKDDPERRQYCSRCGQTPEPVAHPCCLCGSAATSPYAAFVRCGGDQGTCPLRVVSFTLAQWNKLNAPNRLTLPTERADESHAPKWWPVAIGDRSIFALFTHQNDASDYASRTAYREVLAPIQVDVTVAKEGAK